MPFDQLKRREFITLLGGAATAWPVAARAQQPAVPVIGFLSGRPTSASQYLAAAFRKGLSETGYIEGQNIAIEYRSADGQYNRLAGLAADLVGRKVAVIATSDLTSTLPARAATSTIPIVFSIGADPVEAGLVASLNRPGGNLTGVANLNNQLAPKRLELMRELVPAAASIAVLFNPTNPGPNEAVLRDLQVAARTLGVQLHVLHASTERDFDTVFSTLIQLRAGGLVIGADAFFTVKSEQLAALSIRHAVPSIYQSREFAAAGGMMSYGGSITESHRQVGIYTGRILKGEKPADLPVQQLAKVELIINLKTARTLGITVPLALLTRADEVIE
jgi:putative tryptophan/tyrosine transport system substrate-binding protein